MSSLRLTKRKSAILCCCLLTGLAFLGLHVSSFHETPSLKTSSSSFHGVTFIKSQDKLSSNLNSEPLTLEDIAFLRARNKKLFSQKTQKTQKTTSISELPISPVLLNDNVDYEDKNEKEFISNNFRLKLPYVPKERLVHLDLKGAPPNLEYILKVLRLSRETGATGVLLEYEDMFPFHGKLASISAENHYSSSDIAAILEACSHWDLLVIPLVQTFGHMEFILKLPEFSHLRDTPQMPESICSCKNESIALIREYVNQVMKLHPKVSYLHIGCDEVFHLGNCAECREQYMGLGNQLFVDHVFGIASYVRSQFPSVTPIIWDDMLRNLMTSELEVFSNGLVEPMVWVYAEDVYRYVPTYLWDNYARVFDAVWTASAFKGANGPTLVTPNIKRHLENNLNWMNLMALEERKFRIGFRGLTLTGWQRYDHFAVLCELLPVGLPSLVINLLATSHGYWNESLFSSLFKALNCPNYSKALIDLNTDPFGYESLLPCYFPGNNVFKLSQILKNTEREVEEFVKKVSKDQAWLTSYNIAHNYSSPFRIDEVLDDWPRINHEILNLLKSAKIFLLEIYDEFTTSEWIEQRIYPLYKTMRDLWTISSDLKKRTVWKRRPLPLSSLLANKFDTRNNDTRL